MNDRAILIDVSRCTGCGACQLACKSWNQLPAEVNNTDNKNFSATNWLKVRELEIISDNKISFFSYPLFCSHCLEPNCAAVCPVKAVTREDDWVVINEEKCIGCGSCTTACLLNVPVVLGENSLSYKKGKAYKCDACMSHARTNPACVDSCPGEALVINYRNRIIREAKRRLNRISKKFPEANIYGIRELGGLRVIYLLTDKPEKFDLPVSNDPAKIGANFDTRFLYSILNLFTAGLPWFRDKNFKLARYLTTQDKKRS